MTTYYKVVYANNLAGELQSAIASLHSKVTYKINEWSYAPKWLSELGYGLFVFDNLSNAKRFVNTLPISRNSSFEIWECDTDGVFQQLPPKMSVLSVAYGNIHESKNYNWAAGTVMVQRVKLIEKIGEQ